MEAGPHSGRFRSKQKFNMDIYSGTFTLTDK